jgi:hypothetical protein
LGAVVADSYDLMAIPCEACGRPVNEEVVVCPHCGGPTGVPVDPVAEHQVISTLPPIARRRAAEPLPFDKVLPADPTDLPRAIARRRKRRPR